MQVNTFDGVASIVLGDAIVVLWKAPASLERWQWQQRQHEALMAKYPDGIVCFDLVLAGSTPPDGTVRSTMQADFRRAGAMLRRLVVVPIGDSMWLSVVRTIVRAVLLVSGQSKRQVVAASIGEGIERVAEVASPSTPSPGALNEAIALLGKTLDVELPSKTGTENALRA